MKFLMDTISPPAGVTSSLASLNALRAQYLYPNASALAYSFKNLELTQEVSTTQGYIEKLGLAKIVKRGDTWFFLVRSDAVMIPQLFRKVVVAPSEISLSRTNTIRDNPIGVGKVGETEDLPSYNELETNNNLQSEREKTGSFEPKEETTNSELTQFNKTILRSESTDG